MNENREKILAEQALNISTQLVTKYGKDVLRISTYFSVLPAVRRALERTDEKFADKVDEVLTAMLFELTALTGVDMDAVSECTMELVSAAKRANREVCKAGEEADKVLKDILHGG